MSKEVHPEVLARLREPRTPPAGAQERVRARLAASVPGMGDTGGGPSRAGGPTSTPAPWLHGWRGPVALASAVVVGGVGGFTLHASITKTPPPTVVYVDRPVPAPPAVSVPTADPPVETATAPSPSASQVTSAAPRRASPPGPGPSQLAAERAVLDDARTHLVAGEPELALRRLEEHQRRFLNPLLAEERDAMWVEALARAGRSGAARERADAFRRSYPTSLFLPTVDSAVRDNP